MRVPGSTWVSSSFCSAVSMGMTVGSARAPDKEAFPYAGKAVLGADVRAQRGAAAEGVLAHRPRAGCLRAGPKTGPRDLHGPPRARDPRRREAGGAHGGGLPARVGRLRPRGERRTPRRPARSGAAGDGDAARVDR